MTTVIVEEQELDGQTLTLSADAFHHLFRVRRLRAGDRLRVVDGRGKARAGQVSRIERHLAELSLGDEIADNEPGVHVELLVAAPRPQRAAWLVEKATEVGVSALRFLRSARSPRSYGASTLARLVRSARAAVEQCDRSRVPEVTGVHDWQEVPALVGRHEQRLVLDPSGARVPLERSQEVGSVALLIGPEGGWEAPELESLAAAGCMSISLGPRILRVETAALVAAAALLVTSSVDTV